VSYLAQAISVVNAPVVNSPPTLTATAYNPTFSENGAAVTLFSGSQIPTTAGRPSRAHSSPSATWQKAANI
jgi:hypothetical protein